MAPSVVLFDESSGQRVESLPATGKVFAQPVFAEGELLVAGEDGTLTPYAP